jgi:hypothetical protein
VKYWTVHLRPEKPARPTEPVLVREGFSWGALLFGPFWLLAHHAWIPAVIVLALDVIAGALAPASVQPFLFLAIALLVGFSGNDLRRFSLERRGYRLMHVVAARDADGALARLLAGRPDLARTLADGVAA